MPHRKRVLIVGLFLDKNKNVPTQALELSTILKENGYEVLTVSPYKNKMVRLIHTIFYILYYRKKFDVGIVQIYSGLSVIWQLISVFLIKATRKKLILTIHGGGFASIVKRYPRLNLNLLHKADIITCPSGFMIKSLEEYNLPMILIENLIEIDEYEFVQKKNLQPVILWMRALSPIYYPQMAVLAIHELKNTYNYKNIKLYMGGPDMGLKEVISAMIDEYDLKDNIELVGFLNLKKKQYFARVCDIYICTNKIDNAPVSFLEMMAMGVPIVSTNIGGIPYLVKDNETALLVDDADYKAMAKKIDYLLNNTKEAKRLIENGKGYITRFSEENVFKKWDKLLSNL